MTPERGSRPPRYAVEPDPAWDRSEHADGVLVVELSWPPDALAGRLDDLVVSPALAAALQHLGATGFRLAAARGIFNEDAFDVEPGAPPPHLLRLVPGGDPGEDISYLRPGGLTVSRRVLDVLRAHCDHLHSVREVEP